MINQNTTQLTKKQMKALKAAKLSNNDSLSLKEVSNGDAINTNNQIAPGAKIPAQDALLLAELAHQAAERRKSSANKNKEERWR